MYMYTHKHETAQNRGYTPMILEDMEVLAALMRHSLPKSSVLMVRFSLMYLTASLWTTANQTVSLKCQSCLKHMRLPVRTGSDSYLQASLYPLMTEVGWIFCLTSSSAFFSSSAAMITYTHTHTQMSGSHFNWVNQHLSNVLSGYGSCRGKPARPIVYDRRFLYPASIATHSDTIWMAL